MKTMGLSNLWLVQPRDFPSAKANTMAAGAEDMLDKVRVTDSLSEAVADCTVVIASTTRARTYDLPQLQADEAAQMLVQGAAQAPVALVFGPERMGLHNRDIQHAKYRTTITANPDYNSLNLAAAVQIFGYEIFKAASLHKPNLEHAPRQLPSSADLERLHQHIEQVLRKIAFLRPHQGETLDRIRNLIARSQPDTRDTNILRGILIAIQNSRNDGE
jgi:tRNA (cytidine32/uridine32-2'-O)-methyltransferase